MPENPGIGRRLKLFDREQNRFEAELDDPEDLESDFMNTHTSYKAAQKELAGHQEKLGHWIVRNKYFKSHSVNLLTFSEKEQIRHLHGQDREEWTVEKLAASFPATEETISKIIRAKWTARTPQRIEEHDRKVQENWEALKAGSLPGLTEDLRKHLLKFADRVIEPPPAQSIPQERNLLALPRGEFSEIITSCKTFPQQIPALKSGHRDREDVPQTPKYGSNTMITDAVTDHRPMTIELFRHSSGHLEATPTSQSKEPSVAGPDYSSALGTRTTKVEMMPVPTQFNAYKKAFEIHDKITIPRKLRRNGATYKVDDSYFDDDGEFLYRVPGMTK